MSPALNGSSVIRRFERSDAIEIHNGIILVSTQDCHIYISSFPHSPPFLPPPPSSYFPPSLLSFSLLTFLLPPLSSISASPSLLSFSLPPFSPSSPSSLPSTTKFYTEASQLLTSSRFWVHLNGSLLVLRQNQRKH